MSDQLSKFPDAAKLVAQTMLNRWDAAFYAGYRFAIGNLYKSTSEIVELLGRSIYYDPDASKEDDSAYQLHLLYDDPGSVAFMKIDHVGIFQLSKDPSPPLPNKGIEDTLRFIISNFIDDNSNIFYSVSFQDYVNQLSFSEQHLAVKFIQKYYNLIELYNGIPYPEDYRHYDNIKDPGKDALRKLVNLWEINRT